MEINQPKPEDIADVDIRERYLSSTRNCYTQHYIVWEGGQEVGFLSLDLGPLEGPLVIYELFVPRRLRRSGLGAKLLKAAEQTARELGYEWTLVIPKTMDDAFPQTDLEEWYRRNNYEAWEDHAAGGIRKRV